MVRTILQFLKPLLKYGKGSVQGYVSSEKISLDGTSNFTVTGFNFLAIYYGKDIDVSHYISFIIPIRISRVMD